MEKFGIGQPVRRLEDARLLTGAGLYLDDVKLDGMVHGAFVRSPHAHARVVGIDAGKAKRQKGVLGVVTGADWRAAGLGAIPMRAPVVNRDGTPPKAPPRPAIATDRVRFVGDIVAFVVAETPAAAHEAADLVAVAYDPLPAVVDPERALAAGAPLVWDEVPGNLCVDFEAGDAGAVDAAFARAARVVRLDLVNQRVAVTPLEPRGAIGLYDADSGRYTLIASSQNLHVNRANLAEGALRVPRERLRLVAHDVGGGFGTKNAAYPEYALVLFAARLHGRPVKWVSGRSEAFLSDTQGRDQASRVELALDGDARFLALRVVSVANLGAHASSMGPHSPTVGTAKTLGGLYRIAAAHFRCRVVFTHTVPTDPYRGAGRPEAVYLLERVVDCAARELGLDPIELRRRNAFRREELPAADAMGAEIECGDFHEILDLALERADRRGFPARAEAARAKGLRRGFGVSLYLQRLGGSPKEYAALALEADGTASIAVGSQSTGMGHETAIAQILGERLGLPLERIRYRQGDTDLTPIGGGHGGSRTMEAAGVATALVADQVVLKAKAVAAHLLQVPAAQVSFAAGLFKAAGTNRTAGMADVIAAAFHPDRLPPELRGGLGAEITHERDMGTRPNGCHVAEVEVDPETGAVRLVAFTVVDDFGRIINPLIASGQVMGGVAQGYGQAALERVAFDRDSGQLLTGTLMDYPLPRASDLPSFEIAFYEELPTRKNPLGVKGAGEAGAVAAPPAIVNAAVDALQEWGVRHLEMPLTPHRVWMAIQKARSGSER